jgi:putative (di)nucleoside polyphosphate hydrolase
MPTPLPGGARDPADGTAASRTVTDGPAAGGPVPLPLRPAAGIALFRDDGRVFVGRRVRGQVGTWQMPQGGIDDGEAPLAAALRELAEETGIASVRVLAELPEWLTYELPPDLERLPRWASRYRGQQQRWFAMQYLGDDLAIDLATEHPEFDDWRWVRLEETPALVVPFKRGVYERVVAAFSGLAAELAREHAAGR